MEMTFWISGVVLFLLVFHIIINRRLLYIIAVTLPRDIKAGIILLYCSIFTTYYKFTNQTTANLFDSQVKKHRRKPCFYFEDEVWTYEKVQEDSYKVANYFQALGYKKGDTIGLFKENCPEFVCTWLGLSRIGVTTSLLNYNIRLKGLEHCVKVVECKAIIFGTELTHGIQEVIDTGGFQNLELFSLKTNSGLPVEKRLTVKHTDLNEELKSVDTSPPIVKEQLNSDDTVLYIYTSGTTGFPKAVHIKHTKIFCYSMAAPAVGLKSGKDIIITPIPLYHGNGGVCGVTAAIFHGIPQVIIRKFSASKYWEWCIKYNVTASQYLGEIIRYLCNQPEKPEDKLHKVRIFMGNGVNPAIWAKFVQRFKNIQIMEMYAATEGNINMLNVSGKVAACGFLPVWAYPFLPYFLAKVDDITGEIVRDKNTGLAVHATTGEPGEIMAKISEFNPMRMFYGYTDREATKKKIAHDIKNKGDRWFRSGDLVVFDEYGFWYFKDRCGDTYRWKGENVSTMEVEEVVTRGAGMKGTVVYGVEMEENEGKCGMACIEDPKENLDFKMLKSEITRSLPSYARPLFIRITKQQLNMTGTFKLQKMELQKEGFDIIKIKEPIYFYSEGDYVPLDKTLYQKVISGKMRF